MWRDALAVGPLAPKGMVALSATLGGIDERLARGVGDTGASPISRRPATAAFAGLHLGGHPVSGCSFPWRQAFCRLRRRIRQKLVPSRFRKLLQQHADNHAV